ncbi:uncharacterized protein F5147DRAFT_777979 [Suillus discolor]|uniref:Uncharacterized protein n=1 Tax=Suillus discolor TaxID=1912936 RepID=A0A9P7EZN0_9AGAM|nr:uncharacterized protein F5147DRAFT_777979 [Suillus discolor]KAG2097521.1 hypothetical protein F5147DRAFT_777979 [Suillus discolor]
MSSSIRPATSTSVKGSKAPPSPLICSCEAQTLTSGLSSTPRPRKNTTTTISGSISHKKTLPMDGVLSSKNIQIGTPRAMGTLLTCRSPALLHHLTSMPGNYRFSMKNPASPKFPIMRESDCEDHKDSLSESTDSSDIDHSSNELKAQLVLNATQAQRNVCLAEKMLADCILKENAALRKLYKFKATEAKRKLEDTDIDIGFVHHSVRKSGITLYEDSKPRKCRCESASQVDDNLTRPEGDLTWTLAGSASTTPSATFESEAATLDSESVY